MDLEKLKEEIKKQCDVNHQTVVAIETLRRFNVDNNIVESMKPNKSEVAEKSIRLIKSSAFNCLY